MTGTVHICSFSTGIDEMRRADQRDPAKVLAVLKTNPRFSTFEASANPGIARTMTLLFERGLVKDVGGNFPWTDVEILPAGEKVLAGGPIPPKPDPFDGAVRISKRTYVSKSIAEKYNLPEYIPGESERAKEIIIPVKRRKERK